MREHAESRPRVDALQAFAQFVEVSSIYRNHFRNSEFTSSFQYMVALGHFWKRDYEPALDAARIVADGESKDRDFARYILGQIYHAQGKPADAIKWYETVKGRYPDAREAIGYFDAKRMEWRKLRLPKTPDCPVCGG